MIVCHCYEVNDRRILELIDVATTVGEIAAQCGAGLDCGSCVAVIQALLDGRHALPSGTAAPGAARDRKPGSGSHAPGGVLELASA